MSEEIEKNEESLSGELCGINDSIGLHTTAVQLARFNPKELEKGKETSDPELLNLVHLSRQYLTKLLKKELDKL